MRPSLRDTTPSSTIPTSRRLTGTYTNVSPLSENGQLRSESDLTDGYAVEEGLHFR
jgi:hypothetical protein